jgi:hypothetical protein
VTEQAFARGNAVSASNPEAILLPTPRPPYSAFDSALNRMRDVNRLISQKHATFYNVGEAKK